VSYEECTVEGDRCHIIERVEVPEREKKTAPTMVQIYKDIWLEGGGDEADWNQMVEGVQCGRPVELWGDKFKISKNRKGTVSIRAYTKKFDEEDRKIYLKAMQVKESYGSRKSTPFEVDRNGITTMISSMLRDNSGSFRHALISAQNTANIAQQNSMREDILCIWRKDKLAVLTYNHKSIVVKFTEGLVKAHPGLVQKALEEARNIFVADTEAKTAAKGTPGKGRDFRKSADEKIVAIDEDGAGICFKIPEIGLAYEMLKQVGCTRSVAITGAIGGRGISYHDLKNETILTDMYSAIHVERGKTPTMHGEYLIQLLGRVCTIIKPGVRPPRIRLWAPKSMHDLHKLYIRQILDFTDKVQKVGNLEEALKAQPRNYASFGPPGPKQPIAMQSRSKFCAHTVLYAMIEVLWPSLETQRRREQRDNENWQRLFAMVLSDAEFTLKTISRIFAWAKSIISNPKNKKGGNV